MQNPLHWLHQKNIVIEEGYLVFKLVNYQSLFSNLVPLAPNLKLFFSITFRRIRLIAREFFHIRGFVIH